MVAYCPECGSQVAPENTFCAYCGMNLTPLVADAAKAEPSAANRELAENSDITAVQSAADKADSAKPAEDFAPAATAAQSEESAPAPDSDSATQENIKENFIFDNAQSQKESEAGNRAFDETAKQYFDQPHSKSLDAADDDYQFPAKSAESEAFDWEVQPKVESKPAVKGEAPEMQRLKTAAEIPDDVKDAIKRESNNIPVSASLESKFDDLETPPPPPPAFIGEEIEETRESESEAENEFESTIPYTPFDFAKQETVSEATTGQRAAEPRPAEDVPQQAVADDSADEFRSTEPPPSFSPISMPETPVGSSAHDSLAPKAISVQIFDPKESPSEQQSGAGDAQTLIKRETPVTPQAAESKPQTSPNIGREDTDGRSSKVKLKPLDEGTVLNSRYEIIRKIGGGGMGAVYLASDRNLGGVLRAVKEMVQSYIEDAQQEKAISDFKRESLLLTSLEHPAIPTIYDYFYDEKEGRFYLVMKYISGGDLSGRLRAAPEGKMDEASVTEWAMQIADVLDYLHNRQPPIIYRDLKPSNVMIDTNSGRAMLVDFGIARWVNKEEKGVTAVGTMGYAPPELFSGNVEARSDIYSLGSTIFHLLTGADPQSNPLLIFDFNKNPRPRQINSQLSDQMEAILMQMVEYNPDRRFKSAAELRGLLATHLENLKKNAVTFGAGDQLPIQSGAASVKPAVSELVFCGFCGQKIMSTDVFCPFCGAQQPGAAKSARIEAPSFVAPKMTARLLIMSTNDLESSGFSLEKDTNLVGRRDPMSNIFPEVDLSKYDPQTKISRRHARIWRSNNSYMVEDLGSSNGTILYVQANEPLRLGKNQPHVLAHGDKIRIGDTTLHFVVN